MGGVAGHRAGNNGGMISIIHLFFSFLLALDRSCLIGKWLEQEYLCCFPELP